METIHGALSYSLSHDLVSLHITRDGGMMAPAVFRLADRIVSPYSLSPWKPDEVDTEFPTLLKNLRGDFFCLPFGPQENGLPHGETANYAWHFVSETESSLTLGIAASDVSASITKTISLRPEQTAIYYEHRISRLEGDFNYGNHPILDLSKIPEDRARVSVSPFRWASVYPEVFSNPADGAKQALKIGALFSDLSEVPLANGGTTDLTRYPTRAGHEDLIMIVSEDATPEQPFAWTAVVLDGYVWFSLKNPADFPATLFWLSNGGRSAAPWESRHLGRLGIEDVCSYFCEGVDLSRKDLLRNLSIPTTRRFKKDQAVTLRNIQAVASVPENFALIATITPAGKDIVTLTDENGLTATAAVDWTAL